jgi:hypothetical protein
MSNQYKEPKEVPIDILCNRLNELAKHCSNGNLSEFYMRIPAEFDRDADIVLSESSNRIEAMQAKLDAQAEELAALREVVIKQDSNTKQFRRFINSIYEIALKEPENKDAADSLYISDILFAANLIDKKGNPTPLLTGNSEQG